MIIILIWVVSQQKVALEQETMEIHAHPLMGSLLVFPGDQKRNRP